MALTKQQAEISAKVLTGMAHEGLPELKDKVYQIYALCCPDSGEIRYIGKANDYKKRLKSHLRDSNTRNTPLYCWMRKLIKNGKCPSIILLKETTDWQADERAIIEDYRAAGYGLLNLADGGDQPYCSKEVRAENARKITAIRTETEEKKRIYEIKRYLMSEYKKGRLSEAVKQKLRYSAAKCPSKFGIFANV